MEYYSAIKNNEILPLATKWMGLEGIMLSKIRQRIAYDYTYTWNLKQHQKTKLTDTENRLVVATGEGVRSGRNWWRGPKGTGFQQ